MDAPKREYKGNYLLGGFLPVTQSNGEITSTNPGNKDVPPVVCAFRFDHVHEGVVSAERGFLAWQRLALSDRLSALRRYRDNVLSQKHLLAKLVCFETGKPYWEALEEVDETVHIIDFYLAAAKSQSTDSGFVTQEDGTKVRTHYRPRGVVAVIAPGISPLSDVHLHLMPALAFGNSVVLKGSRHAPLLSQAIAETFHGSELPAGVFNLVQGEKEVARRLAIHPGVQAVLFTGSYETGLAIRKEVVSDYWKTTVLDMVGKNGVLVWDDCNYQKALQDTVYSSLLTTGQRRTTANRVLVHKNLVDRFATDLHQLFKQASVGYGYVDSGTTPFMGPLLNEEAVESYIRYQAIAIREGAEEVMRGKPLERPEKGHYVSPSIHLVAQSDPKSVYQKSEIFGPNTALYPVDDLEQAVEAFNLSQHGLVASVYTESEQVFQKAFESVQVGTLHWNRPTHSSTYRLARTGLKKSGNGHPLGSMAWQQVMYAVIATQESDQAPALPAAMPKKKGNGA